MARHPPETRYAQSSGAKIAYQVSSTGPPDLVMVPGLVSHLDIQWQQTGYRRFVRALERGGRLIRLDKRGTGLSDPAAGLPTTQERVRDVAADMAAAKSSRAVPEAPGRFTVTGRWPFNSGCPHAAWLQVGVMVSGAGNLVELAALQQHVAGRPGRPAGRLLMMVKSAHVYETERVYLQGVLAGAADR